MACTFTAAIAAAAGILPAEASTPASLGNPGDPNNPGGSLSATAKVDPNGNDILATVASLGANSPGSKAKSSCRWVRGQMSKVPEIATGETKSQFALIDADGTSRLLYGRLCGTTVTWFFIRQVTARQVAEMGRDQVRQRLPRPRAVFSPEANASSPAVVHLPLWFAVPDAQWIPVSATANMFGLSATVTATPTRLTLSPGDGSQAVSCTGPGPRWHAGMAEPIEQPKCSYRYQNASSIAPGGQSWSARLSIEWRVNWTATNGEAGEFDPMTTTSGYAIPVREIEAVEAATGRRS
jgi:hypothetical protein